VGGPGQRLNAASGVPELVDDSERTPVVEGDVCRGCCRTARQVRLHAGRLRVASGNDQRLQDTGEPSHGATEAFSPQRADWPRWSVDEGDSPVPQLDIVEHLGTRTSYTYQREALAEALASDSPVLTNADWAVANMRLVDAALAAAGIEREASVKR
jgi:hypothetical protein